MSAFAIVGTPRKELRKAKTFNFVIVAHGLGDQAASLKKNVSTLNKPLRQIFGSVEARKRGATGISIKLVNVPNSDLKSAFSELSKDASLIGGLIISGAAHRHMLENGRAKINSILCNRHSWVTGKDWITVGDKTIAVVDYDANKKKSIPVAMQSAHLAVTNDPFGMYMSEGLEQLYSRPFRPLPCSDTSKEEEDGSLGAIICEVLCAFLGLSSPVALAIAVLRTSYNLIKNYLDDNDTYEDYFSDDIKKFLSDNFSGGGATPWDSNFAGEPWIPAFVKFLFDGDTLGIDDLIDIGYLDIENLLDPQQRYHLANFLGLQDIRLHAEPVPFN